MRRILTIFMILTILISCSTTNDVSIEREVAEPHDDVVNFSIREEFATPEESDDETLVEEEVEAPAVESEKSEEIAEEKESEEIPLRPTDKEESHEGKSPVSIVEEISGRIIEPERDGEENPIVEEAVDEEVIPVEEEPDTSDDVLSVDAPVAPIAPQSVLDNKLSDEILYVMIELIVIVFLFTLASVIRNKLHHPLPVFLSILLSLLFTAIPIVATMVLSGWNRLQLIYLILLLSFAVLRSKEKRL